MFKTSERQNRGAARHGDGKGESTSQWTIGLEVSVGPPHTITGVADIQDKHGTEKGMTGYTNEDVCPGDVILKVDGASVESKPIATLNRALKGDLNTTVDIELRSEATNKTYSITALRHARQSNHSSPISVLSPFGKENAPRQTPSQPAPWQSPVDPPVKIPQLIQDCPPILSPSTQSDSNVSSVEGSATDSVRTSRTMRQNWEEDLEERLDRAVARRLAAVEADMERKIEEAVERRTTTMVRYVLEMELQPRLKSAMEDVLHTDRYKDVLDARLSVIFEDILQGMRHDTEGASESTGHGGASSAEPCLQDGDEVKVPISKRERRSLGSFPDLGSQEGGTVTPSLGEDNRSEESDTGSVEQLQRSGEGVLEDEEEKDESLESEVVRQMIGGEDDEVVVGRVPAEDGWDGDGCDEQTLQVAVTPSCPAFAPAKWSKASVASSPAQAVAQQKYPTSPRQAAPGLSYVAHYYM